MADRYPHAHDVIGNGDAVFAGHYAAPAATRAPARVTHAHTALALCTAGSAHAEQRGWFRVERGDLLLVPAGSPHRTITTEGYEAWGIGFSTSSVAASDRGRLLGPFARVRAGASAVVRVPAARQAFLESLFAELGAGAQPTRDLGDVERSLLTLIVHEAESACRLTTHDDGIATPGVVARSLAVIEQRCLSRLTLEDVAAAVGRSPSYVTTALRRETGRSAGAWITAGRMAEARRLLLHSATPVDALAGRVGYADTTHFIRTFRRVHGVTPAVWRAAQRRDET